MAATARATCCVECMQKAGGFVSTKDLTDYRVASSARRSAAAIAVGRSAARRRPPASGVHITQMLNILEGYDIKSLGFGTVDTLHLLAEVLKIAFADRAQRERRSGFRRRAGRAHHLEGLCRPARRAGIDLRPRQALDVGAAGQGRRRHHASHHRPTGRATSSPHHPDHQQPVRRALRRTRHRHGAERLHVELRSAAGQCAVDRAGQAGDDVDGADDGSCATARLTTRWACSAAARSSRRPGRR